jgi:hypothetical protein
VRRSHFGLDGVATGKAGSMTYCPLNLLENYLRRFVAYPSEHARTAHALWIAHTHLIEHFDTTPRLAFMSAEKESGKTRALEVTALLVPAPILSISASPAVIVRLVSQGKATILYDEIDGVFGNAKAQETNLDLRSVLNGGYRRGAKVHRCVMRGKAVETEELDAFSAVAVAGLRSLPDTLASRSIFVRMKRRAPDEYVEPFRHRYQAEQAKPIRQALEEWCDEHQPDFIGAEPSMPRGIEDRAADCWEPLIAIGDVAGGEWPKRSRAAAVFLTKSASTETETKGVELLSHVREAFGTDEKLWTVDILQRLHDRDESPWKEMGGGKPLNDRGLAVRLKDYGIKSRDVWINGKTKKGYYAEDLHPEWKRYLPPCHPQGNDRDEGEEIDNKNKNLADIAPIALGMAEADAFEERAAVREYDGGFSRSEAEALAAEELDLTIPDFMRRTA